MKKNIAISLTLLVVVVAVAASAIYTISSQIAVTVDIEGAVGTANYDGTDVPAYSFSPVRIEVKRDTTVNWINHDAITAHTVTGSNDLFASQLIQPQGKFSFKFDEIGTYSYHCSIHPWMSGEVVVVA